jgi:hypothetical protein
MALGYALSCLSTLYPSTDQVDRAQPINASGVVPPVDRWSRAPIGSFLADAPFVQPSHDRAVTYWSMCKRAGTLSFMVFATGFSLLVYAACYFLADMGGLRVQLFQTFGRNALAAYIIHEMVGNAVGPFTPKDSPLGWVLVMFSAYFTITYLFVRYLERQGIYLRM